MKLSLPALNSYDTAGDENRDPAAGRRMMMGREKSSLFYSKQKKTDVMINLM